MQVGAPSHAIEIVVTQVPQHESASGRTVQDSPFCPSCSRNQPRWPTDCREVTWGLPWRMVGQQLLGRVGKPVLYRRLCMTGGDSVICRPDRVGSLG